MKCLQEVACSNFFASAQNLNFVRNLNHVQCLCCPVLCNLCLLNLYYDAFPKHTDLPSHNFFEVLLYHIVCMCHQEFTRCKRQPFNCLARTVPYFFSLPSVFVGVIGCWLTKIEPLAPSDFPCWTLWVKTCEEYSIVFISNK